MWDQRRSLPSHVMRAKEFPLNSASVEIHGDNMVASTGDLKIKTDVDGDQPSKTSRGEAHGDGRCVPASGNLSPTALEAPEDTADPSRGGMTEEFHMWWPVMTEESQGTEWLV